MALRVIVESAKTVKQLSSARGSIDYPRCFSIWDVF